MELQLLALPINILLGLPIIIELNRYFLKIEKMPKTRKTYQEKDVQEALLAIKNGQMSKKAASKNYKIPRSTLQFRLSENFTKARPGPATVLTEEEESTIVEWLKVSQEKGFPKRKEDVLFSVQEFLKQSNREHPFGSEAIPGKGWFRSFLKRHTSLTFRAVDPVSSASANVAVTDIFGWFDSIQDYLIKNDFFSILEDASRVFNGDETNFLLCPKAKTVLAAKGSRNIYEVDRGQAKSNLTVMFTFNALGSMCPPMIIYPFKRLKDDIRKTIPDTWGCGVSENGWMTKQTFYEYISKVFYPFLTREKIKLPIIFFVDGHSTHLTLQVSQLCVKLGIILIALYPNSTRILQPADVAAFKPLKNAWNNGVANWRRKNSGVNLTKEMFAPLLKEVVDKSISPSTIINGFKACGLFPWDKNSINFFKCLGRSKYGYATELQHVQDQNDAFESFCNIIGQQKIEELESYSLDCENNDDLAQMHKLYNFFKTNEFKRVRERKTFASSATQTDPKFGLNRFDRHKCNQRFFVCWRRNRNFKYQ